MPGKLLLLMFMAIGIAIGAGAALVLAPPDETDRHAAAAESAHETDDHGAGASDFVKLNNQFVVPVVQQDRVSALVVLSLSLETRSNLREVIFQREPKLRDAFLGVLFEHANMGGFDGAFTKTDRLDLLRTALREEARNELGGDVVDVLIESIARQDMQG